MALLLEKPVLPICLNQTEALCGPLFVPGRSVCPACLEHWLDNNLYDHENPNEAPKSALVRGLVEKIAQWSAAFENAGRVEELESGAVSLNYADWSSSRHPVFPLRDCPHCGKTAGTLDTSPQTHCSRWTGIVNRMVASSAPSAGAFRACATWSAPAPVGDARPYLKRLESFGRGRTPPAAMAGCIGEAMERYSLVYRGDEPAIRARFRDVDAIHPDSIQLFSHKQFQERETWNANVEDDIFFVGEPFDEDACVDWLEGQALGRENGTRFVPAACCLMWYQFAPGEPEFARADTVGCGTGVKVEDALAHALLEWIERDAMAIWWDNRLRRPAVRIESFESEELNEVAAGLRAIGRDLVLLDCTTDVGVPAYVSLAPRFDGTEPIFAGASHFSARTAAYKAASEVGQIWFATRISGAMTPSLRRWLQQERLETQTYLVPSGFVDAPKETEVPQPEAVDYIVGCLESAGLRCYAVNHSRSDVLWPTWRAVVPGLRHIWNRRGPGRLYDIPVKMGWLSERVAEENLNPIRCMI